MPTTTTTTTWAGHDGFQQRFPHIILYSIGSRNAAAVSYQTET